MPNVDLLRKHLLREGPIDKEHLIEIIKEATEHLSKYSNQLSNFHVYREGTKCNKDEGTGHYSGRYPWPILRYDSHVRESS